MDSAPPQAPPSAPVTSNSNGVTNSNDNSNDNTNTNGNSASSNSTPTNTSGIQTSQLPPEALALAGRMFDAARNGDEHSVALLTQALEVGLPANLTNDKGDTLIMLAAYHGHAPLVRLLLNHNANPNVLNDRGQSPLAGVIFKAERECIQALLDGGADPDIGTPSAMDACKVFRQEEWVAPFEAQREKLRGERSGDGVNGG